MPAFRLPDDGNCPVYKIPPMRSFSRADLRPIELTEGNSIRIGYRDRRKEAVDVVFLALVDHPFHEGIVKGMRVSKDGNELPMILIEDIDTITKTAIG